MIKLDKYLYDNIKYCLICNREVESIDAVDNNHIYCSNNNCNFTLWNQNENIVVNDQSYFYNSVKPNYIAIEIINNKTKILLIDKYDVESYCLFEIDNSYYISIEESKELIKDKIESMIFL